ncbi:ABC transporter transmembrane domain-containing protein [Haliea sp.]|jgi:ATP-binding cassette subfamily B protein|uniref:ABC transporter transmembrane domain-containing protein n=1 Tax=Haliea TaxID=475794 RepID=UPI000C42DC39|nr:ABC transporter transmembrane domain-containing protein [Haliea sp.]HBX74378.1 ABC transporter ATP-binding protein [Halieaceae bacterium]MAD63805.1 ABC transporter ATP-binding protein [Haliea sp.]MAY92166.1 ABC transporter ATP-binding protein [Haliea sp.]MBK42090.1 ABC transporter ATP-binding protein [Haliea sp.]MBP69850.1 ABC transporter ATP-binding protein [Haliea sp.]|tara:strand:- start:241 stop:1989 length:1749 start_codon:yes stop_codon:yes gene_type:complete
MAAKSGRSLSPLLAILRFLLPYRGRLLAAGTALVFTAGATLFLGRGIQLLIDEGFSGGTRGDLANAIGVILVIAAAMAVGTFARFYFVSWLGERVSADIRNAVFDNIIHLDPGYFETNRSGEIMSRLTTDTTLLQTIIGSSLSMALRSGLTLIGGLVLMFITNIQLSLIITVAVPLVLLPILFFGRRVRRLSTQSQDSIANVGSYAGEIIQHIRTVQSYTSESRESAAFGVEVERAFAIARRRIRQRALLVGAAILLLFGGMAAMLWSGGQSVINGEMSGGELGAFVFYALMVGSGFATISEVWGELQRAAGASERLLDLLHTHSEIVDGSSRAVPHRASLSLRNVTFAYPARPADPALKGLSLKIDEGKSLALVGPSGGGKSTVFQLLLRFYDPQSGAVLFDGVDLRDMRLEILRQQMALVPQQPALFTGTVRYNIAYGMPAASAEEVVAAARAAHAHEFIQRLPNGYDSELGEQGVRLSGGQRQRIALARAILANPRVLLLDEATSALDSESEHQVQLALEELMRNRTTVIIAHRLSTIRHADRIAVLDKGQLVATGTHDSLLRDSPLYARLAQLQFREQ